MLDPVTALHGFLVRCTRRPAQALLAAAGFCALGACSGGSGASTPSASAAVPLPQPAVTPQLAPIVPVGSAANGFSTAQLKGKITHVVVVVQENRSFDSLFYGFPGADTATSGTASDGSTVPLQPISFLAPYDVGHELADFLAAYDGGKLDGFDKERLQAPGGPLNMTPPPGAPPHPQYGYVPLSERQQYVTMANSFALSDRFFPSQDDSSYTAHQYLIAAQTGDVVDNPTSSIWGCDAPAGTQIPILNANRTVHLPGVFPCFDYSTLGDELDATNATWKYYAPDVHQLGIWSAYDAISHIRYGADWAKIVSPESTFLSDVNAGALPNVSWVIPDYANSDHAASLSNTGPQWVSSIVDAVGNSPFWSSTAIVVMWDDWGGWYDHVAPPQLDVHGLGFRAPMLVISPYAKRGFVSHVQYETGSIDRFIETLFGLPALAASDARANDLGDCLTLQPNSFFFPFGNARAAQQMRMHAPSSRPPDDD